VWMHWTVVQMLHQQSPELATHFETPQRDTADETILEGIR
jgi:hypothetical protein